MKIVKFWEMTVKDYLSGRVHGNDALEPTDSVCKYMLGEMHILQCTPQLLWKCSFHFNIGNMIEEKKKNVFCNLGSSFK